VLLLKDPAEHSEHTDAVPSEYFPAEQLAQFNDIEYVPNGQGEQYDKPLKLLYDPMFEQLLQKDNPSTSEYFPISQSLQNEELRIYEKVPLVQERHP
jgi:hypothetical protein